MGAELGDAGYARLKFREQVSEMRNPFQRYFKMGYNYSGVVSELFRKPPIFRKDCPRLVDAVND